MKKSAFSAIQFIDFNALKFYFTSALSGKQTKDLETVIGQLNVDQKETIVKYASEWNKNSRSSYIAQVEFILYFFSWWIEESVSK